jgi:NADPH:quinone reductase-like Zn-dependent oxidoreductase
LPTSTDLPQIYATVGTEEKTQYLVDTYCIPRNHIFNSRNATFLPNVLQATNGRGVDLVINSLSGELLHASWKCVAAYGSMVEIGKRDFIGRGRLNMDSFEANRAFFGVDFAQICAERPDIAQE